MSVNFVDKLGRVDRFWIIEMTFLQLVSKCWHVACWNMFSVDQISASNSAWKNDKWHSLFLRSNSFFYLKTHLAIPNHNHCAEYRKSTIHLLNKYAANIKLINFLSDFGTLGACIAWVFWVYIKPCMTSIFRNTC